LPFFLGHPVRSLGNRYTYVGNMSHKENPDHDATR
jgi:hypothetical protein